MASDLFNLAAQAVEASKNNVYARRAAQRVKDSVKAYEAGQKSRWSLMKDIQNFQNVVSDQALAAYQKKGGMTSHTGFGSRAFRMLRSLTSKMGKIGSVIDKIFSGKQSGYDSSQIRAAAELLRQYEDAILVNDELAEHAAQAAIEALEDHNWNISAVEQTMQDAIEMGEDLMDEADEVRLDVDDPSLFQTGRKAARENIKSPRLSRLIPTPQSSNVYSFQYDYLTSTLYVRFKAPTINQSAVTNYTSKGGMKAFAGDMGRTITGKTDAPGALYAYYDVPIEIYKALIRRESAGKGVWDMLRVRGTVWDTQYRYALVDGAMVPAEGGEEAMYVPRRAVQRGYQSRSMVMPGHGRRKYVSSSLPQDMRGHGTIFRHRHRPSRGRPLFPNRGRPDPPNRGR